ncbi:MAG: aminotransferase class III-fold pyridoxal phosphate-dependent enzyme, partial [Arsenophonus sp. ER-QC15-MAG3]
MNLNDIDFDAKHIWHPYTSMIQPIPAYNIVGASAVELELANGKKIIDGMSSWWAAIHGYNHPILNQAIRHQLTKMSHVMFGGITHPAAIALCRQLID